jgi:hypothetical protein
VGCLVGQSEVEVCWCWCFAQSGVESGVAGSEAAAHIIALSRGVVNTSLETNGGMSK